MTRRPRSSTRPARPIATIVATLTASRGLVVATATPAVALTRDARQACGVTVENPAERTAVVPEGARDGYFINVPSTRDPAPILCGNGTSTGAVHIEMKHVVPNWGDAVTAMVNAIDGGVPVRGADRTTYSWNFATGRTLVVVVGDFSVITAYPLDGREETWVEASVAQ